MRLAGGLPVELRRLQELDADFAEALYVLDRPPGRLDWGAMIEDTRASLLQMPASREAFLSRYDGPTRAEIEERASETRDLLALEDAYLEIPGRDPNVPRRR